MHVDAFLTDIDYLLPSCEVLVEDSVRVKKTGNPRSQLLVTCTARQGLGDDEVLAEVVRFWQSKLWYAHAEVHDCRREGDELVMDFATQMEAGGKVVTGLVRIARQP